MTFVKLLHLTTEFADAGLLVQEGMAFPGADSGSGDTCLPDGGRHRVAEAGLYL